MPSVPRSCPSLLRTVAQRLYSAAMSCPFPLSGSCRALIYRDHGVPSEVCITVSERERPQELTS